MRGEATPGRFGNEQGARSWAAGAAAPNRAGGRSAASWRSENKRKLCSQLKPAERRPKRYFVPHALTRGARRQRAQRAQQGGQQAGEDQPRGQVGGRGGRCRLLLALERPGGLVGGELGADSLRAMRDICKGNLRDFKGNSRANLRHFWPFFPFISGGIQSRGLQDRKGGGLAQAAGEQGRLDKTSKQKFQDKNITGGQYTSPARRTAPRRPAPLCPAARDPSAPGLKAEGGRQGRLKFSEQAEVLCCAVLRMHRSTQSAA